MNATFTLRQGQIKQDIADFGQLLVETYSALPGFPAPDEQPGYYTLLRNVSELTHSPGVQILLAYSSQGRVIGGVVYFADMAHYGSGGKAPQEKQASGIRLLAVSPTARHQGIGKALTQRCIDLARRNNHCWVILHTTAAMLSAWRMYEQMGFQHDAPLDFQQGELHVTGFRLEL